MNPAATTYRAASALDHELLSDRALIVSFYRDIEQNLIHTQLAMHNAKFAAALKGCTHAKGLIAKLIASVRCGGNREAEFRLRLVYAYFFGAVVEAQQQRDPARLAEILPLIAELRCAWERPARSVCID